MRYSLINSFFVIILVSTAYSPIHSMLLKRVSPRTSGTTKYYPRTFSRQQKRPSPFNQEQAVPAISPQTTQIHQRQSFYKSAYASLSRIPNRMQQWWRQWWSGKKAEDVVEEIKNGKTTAFDSFSNFVRKNLQAPVDEMLDLLMIIDVPNNNNAIAFLDASITGPLTMSEKPDLGILEKLTSWASFRLQDLLKQKAPIDITELYMYENIPNILTDLIGFDENRILIAKILENLEQVCRTTNGLFIIRKLFEQGTLLSRTKYRVNQNQAGKRMLEVWKEIGDAIKKNPEKFSPLFDKTMMGIKIVSLENGKLIHESFPDPTIKE